MERALYKFGIIIIRDKLFVHYKRGCSKEWNRKRQMVRNEEYGYDLAVGQ